MTLGQWALYTGLALVALVVTMCALERLSRARAVDRWLGGHVVGWQ